MNLREKLENKEILYIKRPEWTNDKVAIFQEFDDDDIIYRIIGVDFAGQHPFDDKWYGLTEYSEPQEVKKVEVKDAHYMADLYNTHNSITNKQQLDWFISKMVETAIKGKKEFTTILDKPMPDWTRGQLRLLGFEVRTTGWFSTKKITVRFYTDEDRYEDYD